MTTLVDLRTCYICGRQRTASGWTWLYCTVCGRPMEERRQTTTLRADGIPISRAVCLQCWRATVRTKDQAAAARSGRQERHSATIRPGLDLDPIAAPQPVTAAQEPGTAPAGWTQPALF